MSPSTTSSQLADTPAHTNNPEKARCGNGRRQRLLDMQMREDLKVSMSEKLKCRFGHAVADRPDDEGTVVSSVIRKEVDDFVSNAVFSDSNLNRLERRLQTRASRKGNHGRDDLTCVSAYSSGSKSSAGGLKAGTSFQRSSSTGNLSFTTTSGHNWIGPSKPYIAKNQNLELGTSALPAGPMRISGTTAMDLGKAAVAALPRRGRHHLELGSQAVPSGGPLLNKKATQKEMGSMYEYIGPGSNLGSSLKHGNSS